MRSTVLSRRAALIGTSALSVAALAACTSTTVNGVTTITINVASVNAWGQALINGANLVAGLPGISGSPEALAVKVIGAAVSADMTAFDAAAGGSVSLSFNSTSVPLAVSSLVADASTLLSDAQAAVSGVAASYLTTAQTYVSAVQTVVSLLQAAAGSMTAAAMPGGMSEADALRTLKVK